MAQSEQWTWVEPGDMLLSPQGGYFGFKGNASPAEIKSLARGDLKLLEYDNGDHDPVAASTRVAELFSRHLIRRKTPEVYDEELDLRGTLRTFISHADPNMKVLTLAWVC